MIKLSPNIRFSSCVAYGPISARYKTSEELNKKVFQRMLQLYENKNFCGIGVIKNSYNAILPERKNVRILSLSLRDYDKYGAGTKVEESGNCLTGYSIEVPTDKKKKLDIIDLSSFMHESTHVLDYLLNPKYIANYRQMCEKKIYEKKYFSVYEKYFDNTEDMKKNNKKEMLCEAEEKTRKILRKVPHEEKIIFLNFIKYSMEMEYHAYCQDILYAKMLKMLGKPIEEKSLNDFNKYMAFPEKIKIINQLIKEEIVKNRTASRL